jgi:hypothetical protein
MERPKGVTILAYLYLLVAFSVLIALIASPTFDPLQRAKLLALSAAYLIVAITLAVTLLRMTTWSRWLAIVVNATQLLLVPYSIAVNHGFVALIRSGVSALFSVWVIWYLTRPHVKAAFQERLIPRTNTN